MAKEVADGLVQQRLAQTKVWYLEDENLLVDTGLESTWDGLQSFVESQGDVDRVFISHTHRDHIGNLDRVQELYDPEILYPENEPIEEIPQSEDEVTRVSDGQEISEGVHVVEVQGHTPGSSGLYLPEKDTLLAIDLLDGSDRRGLPAGYLVPPSAQYNWDSGQAENNLSKLLEFEFDRAVVTHGSNVDSDARLKLDKFLNFTEHYRVELLASLEE